MQMNKSRGFTLVEILMGFAILFVIIGIIITMMTRGASNVKKGSFNALAANQAFWIVSVMRSDIARSIGEINLELDEDNVWNGDKDFKVNMEGGTATYSIEKKGNMKQFVRTFKPSNTGTAFSVSDSKRQSFGDEYLSDMTVKLSEDNSYIIEITMKDSKSGGESRIFTWNAAIYPPQVSGLDEYWVGTLDDENKD